MPSAFDEFSLKANRDYSDVSTIQSANAKYLEEVMVKHGFRSYRQSGGTLLMPMKKIMM